MVEIIIGSKASMWNSIGEKSGMISLNKLNRANKHTMENIIIAQ